MKKVNSIIIGLLAVCLALWIVLCILLGAGVIGVGPQGPQGPAGSTGSAGSAGSAGKSAFEIFKQYHPDYTGTEEEWLESLKGAGSRGTSVFSGEVAPADFAFGVELIEGDLYMQLFNSVDKTGYVIHRYENVEGVLQWVVILDLSLDSEDAYDSRSVIPINNAEELLQFAQSVNSGLSYKNKTVKLMNDVDFEIESGVANHGLMTLAATNATAWTPIGTKAAPFEGTFDGNGKTISNISCDSSDYSGFVGYLKGGVVKNVTLENVTVSGQVVGAVAGKVEGGSISGVTVSGKVEVTCTDGGEESGCGVISGIWSSGTAENVDIATGSDVTVTSDKYGDDYFGMVEDSEGLPDIESDVKIETPNCAYKIDKDGNWTILNASGLKALVGAVNGGDTLEGKTVKLEADVDLSDAAWTPIGNGARKSGSYTGNSFKGTFDGGNHKITIGSVEETTNADAAYGLFGVIDGGAVRNFEISATITVAKGEQVGAVAGIIVNGGSISKVTVLSGSSITGIEGVGGIVGRILVNGSVTDSVNNATVTGPKNTGGIVGAAYYTENEQYMTISGCSNHGIINGKTATGGIVGLSAAIVSNCTNDAKISGDGTSLGGIVGEQQNYGSISDCTNEADVTNKSSAYGTGGIVGWIRYSGATGSYKQKALISVTGNTNRGSIQGGSDAGGIVGTLYNGGTVTGNFNYAETIKSSNFAAGIVGNVQVTEKTPGLGNTDAVENLGITISNNRTSTTIENITGGCVDLYFYSNGNTVTAEGNE